MKLSLASLFGLLAVSTIAVSCSSGEARLAKEIPGVWQGTPEIFSDAPYTATIVDVYDFAPASGTGDSALSGNISVTGMVNTTTQIEGDAAFIEPLRLSVSARTAISGTWTVIDDDEILLS
ncbi:MAG: hypothetical protein K2K77_03940, partial [Duncaniella sp.]|nr:hypothetical protein [Duncaniella sp.]